MSLKKLSQFFDWNRFSKDKKFLVTGCKVWEDFNTKETLGTAVEVCITADNTAYIQTDGESVSNLFEKLTFKIRKPISIPLNTQVVPTGVKATIYGKYHNELSVKCEDIKTVSQQQ